MQMLHSTVSMTDFTRQIRLINLWRELFTAVFFRAAFLKTWNMLTVVKYKSVLCVFHCLLAEIDPVPPWIHLLSDLFFFQTKTVIDKIQKLVSSEGRFKNLREALKKWAWLFSSSQTLLSAWLFLWDSIALNAFSSAVTLPVFPTWVCTWLTWPS